MIKLYWLSQLEVGDRPVVGEKAWMLSQLKQTGYPVFPGFVISSTAFRQFLENLNDVSSLLADFPTSSLYLDIENPRALQLVAQQSRRVILNAPLPAQWQDSLSEARATLQASCLILRTSLGGQFLPNQDFSGTTPAQICHNQPQPFEKAIKEAWAQLLSAKSLFYWQRVGIKIDQLNLAILVQPMASAIASGIVTNSRTVWEIEGNWGLGQSLIQGEVYPDRFIINAQNHTIVQKTLGNKVRAYRLKIDSDAPTLTESCLEPYLLTPEAQERYCLNDDDIQEVSQLIERLKNDKISWELLEWIKVDAGEARPSSLAITQLVPSGVRPLFSPLTAATTESQLPNRLNGIGAAPGRIQGTTYILTEESSPDPTKLAGSIIVTQKIYPFQLSWIKQASGVITEEGGMTSHGAILARELGIPAVVGVSAVTTWLQTGDSIVVDGSTGTIFLHSGDETKMNMNLEKPIVAKQPVSTPLNYPIGTKLMVNLSQPSSLVKIIDLPVDGLGLLRSELMLLDLCPPDSLAQWLQESQASEIVQQLQKRIRQFAEIFAPNPIFYRTFDDKSLSDQDRRGVLGYQMDSTLFKLELQALSEVYRQGYRNVNLIFPFVRTVEEFRFCRQLAQEFNLVPSESLQLWIMAEVPAVIFELSQYVKAGVQGIAIGTNDLIPLLLGIHRDHLAVSEINDYYFDTVLTALKQLIQQAKHLDIPCSICGQLVVQSPPIVEQLIQWGITTISVEPEAWETTYQVIARAEQRLILQWARGQFLMNQS